MGSGESVVEGNVKVRTEVGWVGWIGEVVVWMVVAMEMIEGLEVGSRGVGSGGGGGSGKLDGEMKGDDEISMGDDRLVGGHRWMTAGGV